MAFDQQPDTEREDDTEPYCWRPVGARGSNVVAKLQQRRIQKGHEPFTIPKDGEDDDGQA